ncbi:peptidase-di-tripeptidase [Helicobacter sp. MIT 00-7814]|nr:MULTISPECIES: peptidase dimerization domain-containing protein [unclassified Helicobacter]RDU56191.1 peptidase-di-tripeptidase [Helicobacter sp. MIT 99-10781]RDU56288.1 peptidase-di-tripeptidase [Helicobacter sp. MIT 00-7814]
MQSLKILYDTTLHYFRQIAQIPHGSFHTQELFAFLCKECEKLNLSVQTDGARNIHAFKGTPKCCLQGHYDMVCVGVAGENLPIEIYEEEVIDSLQNENLKNHAENPFENPHKKHPQKHLQKHPQKHFLRAKDSSLGADNGIAIATILTLAKYEENFELLFTNDEEVGMLGAKALELPIRADILLNLDSEDINEIVLGCAGGVDITAKKRLTPENLGDKTKLKAYRVRSFGFKGGHSGIDIHKNRANAIVEFAHFAHSLQESAGERLFISDIKGGEKRNSIPVALQATLFSTQDLCELAQTQTRAHQIQAKDFGFEIVQDSAFTQTESTQTESFGESPQTQLSKPLFSLDSILKPLLCVHSGVYEVEGESVTNSLNLSLLNLESENLELCFMARANDDTLLKRAITRLETLFGNFDFEVSASDFYSAWKRTIAPDNPILRTLIKQFHAQKIEPKIVQIHAGLECGILQKRLSQLGKNVTILSIGPSIDFPHSIKERLDLQSLEDFIAIVLHFLHELKE